VIGAQGFLSSANTSDGSAASETARSARRHQAQLHLMHARENLFVWYGVHVDAPDVRRERNLQWYEDVAESHAALDLAMEKLFSNKNPPRPAPPPPIEKDPNPDASLSAKPNK
jgi:hypothetical protein